MTRLKDGTGPKAVPAEPVAPNLSEELLASLDVLGAAVLEEQVDPDSVLFTALWQICELVPALLAEHIEVTTLLDLLIQQERSKQQASQIVAASMQDLRDLGLR